jgi:hypothetical protein
MKEIVSPLAGNELALGDTWNVSQRRKNEAGMNLSSA